MLVGARVSPLIEGLNRESSLLREKAFEVDTGGKNALGPGSCRQPGLFQEGTSKEDEEKFNLKLK